MFLPYLVLFVVQKCASIDKDLKYNKKDYSLLRCRFALTWKYITTFWSFYICIQTEKHSVQYFPHRYFARRLDIRIHLPRNVCYLIICRLFYKYACCAKFIKVIFSEQRPQRLWQSRSIFCVCILTYYLQNCFQALLPSLWYSHCTIVIRNWTHLTY